MSFVDQDDVMDIMSEFATGLFKTFKDVDLGEIPRLSYREAMDRYGSDRPDLRFELTMTDVSAWPVRPTSRCSPTPSPATTVRSRPCGSPAAPNS